MSENYKLTIMKELSIEEKAKAYDEALERAKNYHSPETECNIRIAMENLFPELKENEDEKIRLELIHYLRLGNGIYNYPVNTYIKWLEKQGEKKEINLVDILKHYPRETELFSPLYGKLWLAEVDEKNEIITCYKYPLTEGCVRAILEQEDTVSFYSNGTTGLPDFSISKDCMLFLYDTKKQGEQKSVESLTAQEAMDIAVAKCFEESCNEALKEASDYNSKQVQGKQKPSQRMIVGAAKEAVFEQEPVELSYVVDRENIEEYAYQCAYDLSNDWAKESPDWHDVETACKLGAEWKEKHLTTVQKPEWSEEDENELVILRGYIRSGEWSTAHISRALGIIDSIINKMTEK